MITEKKTLFCFARYAREIPGRGQRALFVVWNAAALLLSSLFLAVCCLRLGIGLSDPQAFMDYFRFPLLLLLNWLPLLLLQLLLYCLFNRHWAAYLGTAALFLTSALGDFYKLKFRGEPFLFSDFSSIGTALGVSENYDLRPNRRILLILAASLLVLALLVLLARGRCRGRARLLFALLALLSVWPLWRGVYTSEAVYSSPAATTDHLVSGWVQMRQISKGFVYQFLYSTGEGRIGAPEGYDDARTAALLASFDGADIPEERKVNLLVFQLEAFTDLGALLDGVDPAVYDAYHRLLDESLHGTLVTNVFGGGTVYTERTFLTGSSRLLEYSAPCPSHVRYLTEQGYVAVGSHPNSSSYYNRRSVNGYLGFDRYRFADDYYRDALAALPDPWFSDALLFPAVTQELFSLAETGVPVFSFNVTMQGHSPYADGSYGRFDTVYWDGDAPEELRGELNRYLGSVRETGELLSETVETLRASPVPVVLLVYGDHKPGLTNAAAAFREMGINLDLSTWEGVRNYYGTTWLIWANDAACDRLGRRFTGEGPTLSPGFLMARLFRELGWTGSAYTQFLLSCMERLPVCTAVDSYLENGVFTDTLSPEGAALLRDWECLQYYRLRHFGAPGVN